MKKMISIICLFVLCCAISTPTFALDRNSVLQEPEEITAVPEKISAICESVRTRSNGTTTSECEALLMASEMTEEELQEAGYSTESIREIRSGAAEQRLREAIFERAALPAEQLANMGYTETEIIAMKNLTGSESLAELDAMGASAECAVYNDLVSHYYVTAEDKTYFICSFEWEWDKSPVIHRTDCLGMGWNHDFRIDRTQDAEYNMCYVTYVNPNDPYEAASKYDEYIVRERKKHYGECQFKVDYGDTGFYAKYGMGVMCLSQVGKAYNAKFEFNYGHSDMIGVPSVGIPPVSGSVSFENVSNVFRPIEIVNSSSPRIE